MTFSVPVEPNAVAEPLREKLSPMPKKTSVVGWVGVVPVLNVAVTFFATVMLTVQVLVPEQSPLQPEKVPLVACAVRVTAVPLLKLAEQVEPQLMPDGLLVTVPLPTLLTERVTGGDTAVKVAVTFFAAVMLTVQVLLPEQSPLQPVKVPLVAVAVSVTLVPLSKLAEQVDPQLMPEGLLVTVPLPVPVPDITTVRVSGGGRLATSHKKLDGEDMDGEGIGALPGIDAEVKAYTPFPRIPKRLLPVTSS